MDRSGPFTWPAISGRARWLLPGFVNMYRQGPQPTLRATVALLSHVSTDHAECRVMRNTIAWAKCCSGPGSDGFRSGLELPHPRLPCTTLNAPEQDLPPYESDSHLWYGGSTDGLSSQGPFPITALPSCANRGFISSYGKRCQLLKAAKGAAKCACALATSSERKLSSIIQPANANGVI